MKSNDVNPTICSFALSTASPIDMKHENAKETRDLCLHMKKGMNTMSHYQGGWEGKSYF